LRTLAVRILARLFGLVGRLGGLGPGKQVVDQRAGDVE
jgi:hypothetical protein